MSSHSGASPQQLEQLHARLVRYMDKHNLRSTGQRRTVTEIFFRTGGHLSIDELHALVRDEDPKIGYATVYRTLKLLTESGIAHEHHFGDGLSRYEISHKGNHHDHLICTECGSIAEFENEEIEALQKRIAQSHRYELSSHKLELYGICPACQRS